MRTPELSAPVSVIVTKLEAPLPWLASDSPLARPLAIRVLALFATANIEIRFIGGCVRDLLTRQLTRDTDIDLATPAVPEAVTALLQADGLTVKPTGIAFGTVTVVGGKEFNHDKLEITTLRRDIATDGRHATVAFGTDWQADAARRDFTLNALSVAAAVDGTATLYDYTDGQGDLQQGRVRFIGDPIARVREDYLRILRFFRFHARFANGEADAEALGACAALKGGMADLSAERIWQELGKLLALPRPPRGLVPMDQCGVLDLLFRQCGEDGEALEPDFDRLEAYAALESHSDRAAVPLLRLAALYPEGGDQLAARLKLSTREAAWLELASETLAAPTAATVAQVWYWHRATIARAPEWLMSLALLYQAATPERDSDAEVDELLMLASGWTPPQLPLAGRDLVALGVESGPRMGEVLETVERWWVLENFTPDRAACLASAKVLLMQE